MPEYLAPGVFVEEVSFRARTIEGVSTTTTGFIGPTRYGPLDIEPEIVTSLVEFERTYGGKERMEFDDGGLIVDNYMWHAVRAFFEEGGKRLYVSRVYAPTDDQPRTGYASLAVGDSPALLLRARFPGRLGDARVTFTFSTGQNVLDSERPVVRSLQNRDVILIRDVASPAASPPSSRGFFLALLDLETNTWSFSDGSGGTPTQLADLTPGATEVRVVTVTVAVDPLVPGVLGHIEENLPLDPAHTRTDIPDSLFDAFAPHVPDEEDPTGKVIANLGRARINPLVILNTANLGDGLQVLSALLDADPAASVSPDRSVRSALEAASDEAADRRFNLVITGGDDGTRPGADEYEGDVDAETDVKSGLKQFEDLEDISIVAAPGATFGYENGYGSDARTIVRHLINHAQKMKYRIAVLDSGDNQSISQVRAMRGQLDSTHAALYYPWVRILDPLSQSEIHVPPSGFVAGIYARNDINRAVYKAPANEVVNLALGFERFLNKSQQEVLNPEGINCFRFFEGRGMRLWGARTISSDSEWKYVNVRRYFAFLERSIDKATQFAVFEPNGELLWSNVRSMVEDFLFDQWKNGALLGDKPEKAFFVKCDRSTMSQNDLDNGRLICLVGVAPLKPAEFVIFRIGQWTADRRV